jgi:riboflavin synthase
MFTGVVSTVGRVASVEPAGSVRRLVVEATAFGDPVSIGGSVCFSGICLTVTGYTESADGARIAADLGPETLQRTTAAGWVPGTRINLERALRVGDEFGGHLVTGHVDGIAEITGRKDVGETVLFRFAVAGELARFIATKGSVALDGTSLTINQVDGTAFACHLIPHTLAVTNWAERKPGDRVNLEVDLIARYTERLLAERP